MTALAVFGAVLDLSVVVALCVIALRIRAIERAVDGLQPLPPEPTNESTEKGNRRMSLSANARRQHGLALVRRTIASGKYTKKDVSRWEGEFGAETIQALLPENTKPASASKSASKSKE